MSLLLNNNVGYTIVGNPTIIDGIVSDFTANDYVKIILSSSIQKLEFNTVLTISNTNWQYLFNLGCDAYINGGSGQCIFRYTNTLNQTSYEFVGSISTNIPVSFNIHINNNILVLNVIQNEQTIYSNTVNDFLISSLRSDLTFSGSDPLSGTLNLNETYIKINDITWFNGKQTSSTSIQDIKFNNNIGYTTIGTPTISDGIASNFSNGNYIKLQSNIPIITSFEENVRFKITQYCAGKNCISYLTSYNGTLWAGIVIGSGLDSINAFLFKKYDGTYEAYSIQYDFSQHLNKYFTFKVYTDLSNVYLYLYDENNTLVGTNTYTNINLAGIIDDNKILIGNIFDESDYWPSEIDLNNTYIKFNGITYFNGKQNASTDVNYVMQNNGSVGYEIVGNPIINNGVASGFSDSDYCKTSITLKNTEITEFVTKVNIPSSSLGLNRYMNIIAGVFQCTVYSDTTNFQYGGFNFNGLGDLYFNQPLLPDTNYWIKYTSDGTTCTAYLSTDGINYVAGESKSISSMTEQTTSVKIGEGNVSNRFFVGSIDLNETYIKVNNNYWFNGNSKLLWTDNNIYLQNLTGGGSGSDFGYIDAGFKPTNKTTFEFSFTKKATSGSTMNASPFFVGGCTRDGITYNPFGINFHNSDFPYFGYTFSMSYTDYDENKIYSTEISNGNYIYKENGIQISSTSVQPNQTTAENLYIGCWDYCYDSGSHIPHYPMLGNLYYAKFWEDGILIRHFVPVPANFVVGGGYQTPSIGMFDIVEQKFYPNLGTDSFTYGKN